MSLRDKHAVDALTRRVEELEARMEALGARVSKLGNTQDIPVKRGPGRPPKAAA